MQKVLLAAVQTPDTSDRQFDMQIEELEELGIRQGEKWLGSFHKNGKDLTPEP